MLFCRVAKGSSVGSIVTRGRLNNEFVESLKSGL